MSHLTVPTQPMVMVVVAHPHPQSLNHAIADRVSQQLQQQGYGVWRHDLYDEPFALKLPTAELQLEYPPPADIAHYCRELQQATGLVVIHPNWWGQMPAVLKGWIDRVFMPGVVHSIPAPNAIITEGLLQHLAALVINTSDVELERELEQFGDPLATIWERCVLGFCEVRSYRRLLFTGVYQSSAAERAQWLQQSAETAAELFPAITAN